MWIPCALSVNMNENYRHKFLFIKMQKYSFFFFFTLYEPEKEESFSKKRHSFDNKIKMFSMSCVIKENRKKKPSYSSLEENLLKCD